MLDRHIRALRALTDPKAPRVMTTSELSNWLTAVGVGMPGSTLDRFVSDLIEADLMRRVYKGLFLNNLANPPPVVDEAAGAIRPGAVISLQRALGMYGVLNNPSHVITAVVPIHPGLPSPKLGTVQTEVGAFQFRGIPVHVACSASQSDRLQTFNRPFPGAAEVATPEKALVDWLYLARTPRSEMAPPPEFDIDTTMLDEQRFAYLADSAGIRDYADQWMEKARIDHKEQWDIQANKMGYFS